MRTSRPITQALGSAPFRFALFLALLVALGAGALLVAVERQVGHYAREAAVGMLQAESAVLAGEHAKLGIAGLVNAIDRHRGAEEDPPYRYLVTDRAGKRLAGDLPLAIAAGQDETFLVPEKLKGVRSTERMSVRRTTLPDGTLLVVATDGFDVQQLRDRLGRFTLISGVAIALLALVGGYLVGRAFLRRLDDVNRAVDRIIDGDRAERLPMIGFGPEFDDLARNLNRMLERNWAAIDALRNMSTDIAHDLRTPLSRLHQRLERMEAAGGGDPCSIGEALHQTEHLLRTFEALLRIGTVEGGVGRRFFGPVDLSELMDRIHAAYLPVVEDAGQTFECDHAHDVVVLGDAELLAQLFINLVENAMAHTARGTTIRSTLEASGDVAVVEIRDDGPGIPVEERELVFRRFYRRDASRSTDGSGLGLALVAAVASLHQASCNISDADPGLIVRLTFRLLPTHQLTGSP